MSVIDDLTNDLKVAMKSHDKVALAVIRGLKSQLTNAQIDNNNEPLTEEQSSAIILKEIKQQKESITEFKKANRDDLVTDQEEKLAIAMKYAPQQMSTEAITALVKETIQAVSASSMGDFGKVMGALMPKVKGKADGNLVNQIVKSELSK